VNDGTDAEDLETVDDGTIVTGSVEPTTVLVVVVASSRTASSWCRYR
jgi:hypothetical protein